MGSIEKNVKTKSRKTHPKLPRRVSEMSKEALEATLRKKSECNAKAHQIVEQLLESNVSEDWFLNCLKFISESHYQDIIEERAITMNCGYPLCMKKLKNIPTQQYHISTKLNKVYDITERKW
ncbi:putative RNA polymerase II subunit B1 CTD phosphatase RPAP2 [Blattella germanica]|nr:putative RNA polymerase II subunit B1 CTD phosphatase RPAP2 [Blattella germanica]